MKIDILGTIFTVQSDQDPSYLRDVTQYFTLKVEDIKKSVSTNDPLKISILAGLLIVDDYFKIKNQKDSEEQSSESHEIDSITVDLITKLDRALESVSTKIGD